MKKKNIIWIIVFILLMIGIGCLFLTYRREKNIVVEDNQPFEWYAKYIWTENNEDNTWTCFRKNFNIASKKDIKNVICRIAADSKYWLYINGKIVIRDGQLKRGERENSIYYDELCIDSYLKVGENNISILVWYFGKDSFSHVDSGQGALLFQAQIGDKFIISDDSWRATKNIAYLNDEENINGRLSEENIYYDANLELDKWYLNTYDDSSWNYAKVCGEWNDSRWGTLIKRDIPFFTYSKIKNYENEKADGEILEMQLPYNMQIVPYLKIKATANQTILISNDQDFDNQEIYGKVKYITKDGLQEFESPSWINGNTIYYQIPEGVEIIKLGYRQTGYNTKTSGEFQTDDEDLNTLWEMANRTLYLNMRDTYMDCPDRERAMWIGDTSLDMEEAMYGLDTSAYALYEKSIKTFLGWQQNGVFHTVSPSVNANLQLPIQNLLAICSMYDYYQYTGNKDFIAMIYPHVKEYMNLWVVGDDGVAIGMGNYYFNLWQWYDSQGITDSNILEKIWYYYALKNLYQMANVLELEEDAKEYQIKLDKMYQNFNENFWDGKAYKSRDFDIYDVRANAIAVLAGIADKSKYNTIAETMIDNYNNSVFMEKYILEALCQMGKIEDVQARIKTRYGVMIENEEQDTTLWEYWNRDDGGKNHAWAGGPLVIMSKYFAGIQPLKSGYAEILIKPDFGMLHTLQAKVNTLQGIIQMKANKKENQLTLQIKVPQRTLVAIEKMNKTYTITINNKTIYKNGELQKNKLVTFDKEDEKYVYLYVDEGKYRIQSK